MLGQQHPAGHLADLVAGAADALQGADATLGGDSICTTRSTAPMSMPSSRLEVATTQGSRPRLRSSSMSARCSLETEPWWARAITVRAPPRRELRRTGPSICAGLPVTPWVATARRRYAGLDDLGTLGGDLVEAGGQPLGEPAGVGEDDRRAVLLDEVDDPLLDVRPDGGAPLRAGGRPLEVGAAAGGAELAHVLDRDDDLEVPLLVGRRRHDLDRVAAAEEAGDLVDRADRRRQADPLGGPLEQRVEALERQREVRAALGAGDGVHLVDDHGLDAAQRLAGLRGEHQEQRLGRGDEDVRRSASRATAARWRGCRRSGRRR